MDLAKYASLICKVCEVLEEAAKLTDNVWDDIAAKVIHDTLDKFFNVVHAEPQKMHAVPVFGAEEAKALPAWILPFLPVVAQLVQTLIEQLVKKNEV